MVEIEVPIHRSLFNEVFKKRRSKDSSRIKMFKQLVLDISCDVEVRHLVGNSRYYVVLVKQAPFPHSQARDLVVAVFLRMGVETRYDDRLGEVVRI